MVCFEGAENPAYDLVAGVMLAPVVPVRFSVAYNVYPDPFTFI